MKKKPSKQPPAISRLVILQEIADDLHGLIGWAESMSFDTAQKYNAHAESLIELLEVADCGSIGGFDDGQKYNCNLFYRWDWLVKKYHDPKDFVYYQDIEKFFINQT